MPDLDLDAIEARLDAATPGPWGVLLAERIDGTSVWRIGSNATGEDVAAVRSGQPADADLIAHAPTDLAALVAEVKHLRKDYMTRSRTAGEWLAENGWLRTENARLTGDLAVAIEVARERGDEVARLCARIEALRDKWQKQEAAGMAIGRQHPDGGVGRLLYAAMAGLCNAHAIALDALLREGE